MERGLPFLKVSGSEFFRSFPLRQARHARRHENGHDVLILDAGEYKFMTKTYRLPAMCRSVAGINRVHIGVMEAVAFASLAVAGADAATYRYTGVAYSQIQGGCLLPTMYVSASFSVPGKLPPNSQYLSVTPLSWRMSDGVNIASGKSRPNSQVINVSTDAHSKIIAWDLSTQYVNKKAEYVLIETAFEPAANLSGDLVLDGACKTGGVEAITTTPGTW